MKEVNKNDKAEDTLYRELSQFTKDKTIWKEKIPYVASLLKNQSPQISAKAMWLLGEMGLLYPQEIATYTEDIARFIASENISTNTPAACINFLHVFEKLLDDENERVRMEAPEIFRVIGKRKSELVLPYLEKLNYVVAHDANKVVCIHARGAIKATLAGSINTPDNDSKCHP